MNRTIKLILTVLLILTFIFNNNVFAEIIEKTPLLKSINGHGKHGKHSKGKHPKSICSIFVGSHGPRSMVKGYIKSFSHARGQLTLLGKSITSSNSMTSLGSIVSSNNKEAGIYKGNGASVSDKKVINFRGSNLGSILTLKGTGMSGNGYEFTLNIPNNFCVDSKKRNSSLLASIATLSFHSGSKSIRSLNASIIGNPRLTKSSKGATITGKIDTGKGEGRFVINLAG